MEEVISDKAVNRVLYPVYHPEIPSWFSKYAECDAMRRIREVGMNCGLEYTSFPLYKGVKQYSRYDHSIGVALIVWHFTGDRKQALAGLFHDISTPAFAHVIDFFNGDHMHQESTEALTGRMIRESAEIMNLLEKDGIRAEEVMDYHLYPIADNDSPKLSADRLEYTLGNFLNYHFGSAEDCARFYNDLVPGINEEGETELMFTDPLLARDFTLRVLKNSVIYTRDEDRYAMEELARILKKAVSKKILKVEDLYRDEPWVIGKLKEDPQIRVLWEEYCHKDTVMVSKDKPEGEGWMKIDAKKRWIDPYIQGKGRVSECFEDAAEAIHSFKEYSYDYWVRTCTELK